MQLHKKQDISKLPKPDISKLVKTGHFYIGLTTSRCSLDKGRELE
jgi:hypothetical protein